MDPVRELEDFYDQMTRLMPPTLARGAEPAWWRPAADLSETDDAYVVEVELPGVPREHIDVAVAGNELAITGELKERERAGMLRQRTRRWGRFEYRTTLPQDVDADKIDATLSEGVLTVRVPKTERGKSRKVEITQS